MDATTEELCPSCGRAAVTVTEVRVQSAQFDLPSAVRQYRQCDACGWPTATGFAGA